MLNKFLEIATKVLAVVIVLVTIFLLVKLYQNKYMLVHGQDKTLQGSIYSSKDLEIALMGIDISEGYMELVIKNKSAKTLNIDLEQLQINKERIDTTFYEDIDAKTTLEALVNIPDYETLSNIDSVDFSFIVNNIHNIYLAITVN